MENESLCEKCDCDFQADNLKAFLYHLTTEHLRGTNLFKCSEFLCLNSKDIQNFQKITGKFIHPQGWSSCTSYCNNYVAAVHVFFVQYG